MRVHTGRLGRGFARARARARARAGGYPAPPVAILKDVDLYRLLRASDAHLGMLSTVLTDAVGAGTPNLIVTIDQHSDLLGYVDAGVAGPVRDVDDVRTKLASDLWVSSDARAAFMARHFRPGDATARILELVATLAAGHSLSGSPADHSADAAAVPRMSGVD